MNYGIVEEILSHYETYKALLNQTRLNIKTVQQAGEYDIGGTSYNVLASKTNQIFSKTENNALDNIKKRELLLKHYKDQQELLEYLINTIDNVLNTLEQKHQDMLRYKYFEKLNWRDIAQKLDTGLVNAKSHRWRKALQEFKNKVKEIGVSEKQLIEINKKIART